MEGKTHATKREDSSKEGTIMTFSKSTEHNMKQLC